jgi:hypothetical protein
VTGLALIAVTATVNVGGSVTGCTAGLGNLIELAQMAIVTIEIQMKPFEWKVSLAVIEFEELLPAVRAMTVLTLVS